MRHIFVASLVIALLLMVRAFTYAEDQDIRVKYGTKSLEAAKQIDLAISLSRQKKLDEALRAITDAIRLDPQARMSYYWMAHILADSGDVDEAISVYKKCRTVGDQSLKSIAVNADIDLALLLASLKREQEAAVWFSQAVLDDPNDTAGLQWKAYRNLAVALHNSGDDVSASLAAVLAAKANPREMDPDMLDALLRGPNQNKDVARVLITQDKVEVPKFVKRQGKELAETTSAPSVTEPVAGLLSDPQGRFVLVMVAKAAYYQLIDTTGVLATKKIDLPETPTCWAMRGGSLFIGTEKNSLLQLEPATGKVSQRWEMPDVWPSSIAPLLENGEIYVTSNEMIHRLDTKTGKTASTEMPGFQIASHPCKSVVFAFMSDPQGNRVRTRTIYQQGRPMTVHTFSYNYTQATLLKFLSAGGKLLLAEMRGDAGATAQNLCVSPDGNMVGLVSWSGWRSELEKRDGFMVPMWMSGDVAKLAGCFATNQYPQGCAVNPVTGQVAVTGQQSLRVYHFSDEKTNQEFKAPFGRQSVWSGDGKYLFVSLDKGGLKVFRNELTADEAALALAWPKSLEIKAAASRPSDSERQAIPELASFAIVADRKQVQALVDTVLKTGLTDLAPDAMTYKPYADMVERVKPVLDATKTADKAGARIYQLKALAKDSPKDPAVLYFLGNAQKQVGKDDDARVTLLAAVQADAGRTIFSIGALEQLAQLCAAEKNQLGAIYCLASALRVDRLSPRVHAQLLPLLEATQMTEQVAQLQKLGVKPTALAGALPALGPTTRKSLPMKSDVLFEMASPSVVLVQTEKSSGSGVCIASRKHILTNLHVVQNQRTITVTPFKVDKGKLVKLETIAAQVVASSETDDLCVLQLEKDAPGVYPLEVADTTPKAGEKVYAIGSPGLDRQVLAQSITDGIVSATARELEGRTFIQHTAAINPGNSGGPLMNERGQVVGINTMVARLNSVGFAVPCETIRKLFKKGG